MFCFLENYNVIMSRQDYIHKDLMKVKRQGNVYLQTTLNIRKKIIVLKLNQDYKK